MSTSKIYVVVRNDLIPGLQAAQACHALREFIEEHPNIDKQWHEESKTLVLLGVPWESDLKGLVEEAKKSGVPLALNYEPDLDDELTAVAFGTQAKKMLRTLPLLLST